MPQPVTPRKSAGLLFLGLLFMVLLVAQGTFVRAETGQGLLAGDRVLSHQGLQFSSPPPILTPTLTWDLTPDGSDDLFCHHAYSGPLPSWECHHPETHLSFSPLSSPGALEESLKSPQDPGRNDRVFSTLLFATSPSLISPDRPPRHMLPL
jgi:hypothetical protein